MHPSDLATEPLGDEVLAPQPPGAEEEPGWEQHACIHSPFAANPLSQASKPGRHWAGVTGRVTEPGRCQGDRTRMPPVRRGLCGVSAEAAQAPSRCLRREPGNREAT